VRSAEQQAEVGRAGDDRRPLVARTRAPHGATPASPQSHRHQTEALRNSHSRRLGVMKPRESDGLISRMRHSQCRSAYARQGLGSSAPQTRGISRGACSQMEESRDTLISSATMLAISADVFGSAEGRSEPHRCAGT
jgi:hypothetical protein